MILILVPLGNSLKLLWRDGHECINYNWIKMAAWGEYLERLVEPPEKPRSKYMYSSFIDFYALYGC